MDSFVWDILKILGGVALTAIFGLLTKFLFSVLKDIKNQITELKTNLTKDIAEIRTQVHQLTYEQFKSQKELLEYIATKYLNKEEFQIHLKSITADTTRAMDSAQAAHDRLDGRKDRLK